MLNAENPHRHSRARRAATARRLGEEQMQLALDAATSADPSFGARAYAFIVAYVREQAARLGGVSGEQVTLAAQQAGIGAEREGFRACCITECCNGSQKTHKGYLWRHVVNQQAEAQ